MPLVEVVRGQKTASSVLAQAMGFVRRIDKFPLPVQSSPGFLVNRVLTPYLLEAVRLMDEGFSATAIDAAATHFGMPMGPIELADTVGLDICLSVGEKPRQDSRNARPGAFTGKSSPRRSGSKTGRGFYAFHKGKAQKTSFEAQRA